MKDALLMHKCSDNYPTPTVPTSGNTPETDALMDVWRVGKLLSVSVMLDHARKLESERDEARERYFVMRDLSDNATEVAEKYKRERDEALLELGAMQSVIADALNLHATPTTANDVRKVLEAAK